MVGGDRCCCCRLDQTAVAAVLCRRYTGLRTIAAQNLMRHLLTCTVDKACESHLLACLSLMQGRVCVHCDSEACWRRDLGTKGKRVNFWQGAVRCCGGLIWEWETTGTAS